MKNPKKTHPHSLPHLSDASSHEDLLAGSAAWAPHIADGGYKFVVTHEEAIDETTDLLVIVRKKVK